MSEHDLIMEAAAGPSRSSSKLSPFSSPLTFDLCSACRIICQDFGAKTAQEGLSLGIHSSILSAAFSSVAAEYSAVEISSSLSHLLSQPSTAPIIIRHCGPILLQLFAAWLDEDLGASEAWENRFVVVASLADIRPDLWRCVSFIDTFISLSPFKSSPLAQIQPCQLQDVDTYRLHDLLVAYNRLLIADLNIAKRNDWPIDALHLLRTQHPDTGVRLMAIQALSKQTQWSEQKRMEIELESVGRVSEVDCPVAFGWELSRDDLGAVTYRRTMIDGWLFPIREAQRVERYQADCLELDNQEVKSSSLSLAPSDLTSRIALVADTCLLRASHVPTNAPIIQHVATSAATSALRNIIPLLQLGLPTLITSSPSSGKTHILHYLSSQIYPSQQPTNRILTIPLADTTIDVKSLIGTYVSSPTKPGTFEWMEGALAKAVRAGRWVVFDDIDRASTEMLVTVAGLARSLRPGRAGRRARLTVPGREEIEAGLGFAVFATRTTRSEIVPPGFFGHHNFTEVVLDAPTDDDILAILSASFPKIPQSVTTTLVKVWQLLRPLSNIGGPVKGRDIGLRDLEKWCARVDKTLPSGAVLSALESNPSGPFANPVLQDEILLEAADTFMAWFDARSSSLEKRASMIRVVAEHIGMDEERAFALLGTRRPVLEKSTSSKQLRAGRSSMPIFPASRRQRQTDSRSFALTKPSLVLLERIAASASMGEPTLLVGETGTGKTTAVQHIATICRKPLTALNLSTQTETSDLLGGFKPIDAGVAARVLQTRWQQLFTETFSMAKTQNGAYLEAASKALAGRKWGRLAELWASSARRAVDKFMKKDESDQPSNGDASPRKRRKVNSKVTKAGLQWQSLLVDIADFDLHHVKMKSKLVFSFVEGPLVKALRDGEWLLLDEVNLASQDTLEAISTLLEGTAASLVLTERGDVEPIPRHPDFRLFACMNPATDVGKKDLPPILRARFTELYVPPPDDDREALTTIVAQYLGESAAGDRAVILDVVEMYSTLKRLSASKEIVDGSNTAPHFSMRTLARALMFAVETAPIFGLRRGLWEGCLMAFTMSLDLGSAQKAHAVCEKYLLSPMKNARAVLSQIPSLPAGADADDYVRFGPFWLRHGPLPPVVEERYVITPSVQAKLSDLARVILTHRYPVLIQGPTSAGKTSAVEFLAKQTGHRFVRINNHEHTDIQEYLGTYVTDPQSGNLVFQEGLLVTAVRQGHWIVLDELNLAPTDVLEALNRLLDDNRELVIPETQEVIKPHPNFILFATQNPPGLYAGRKVLSRAFRNRFLEVHFDDVPKDELETILCQRCQIAPSYAKKIVQVFEELRHRRQASRVFESKSSFATLRDLFRWAERGAVGYEQLANDGYMLLAERARQQEDKVVIKTVIEDIMKVTIDESSMYRLFENPTSALARLPFNTVPSASMVWTNAMQRLFALVASALAHNEPVLLVGETGCGKTSICEVVSAAFAQRMVGVNCHQNMETADLLGSQRPVRNRHERRAKVTAALGALAPIPALASEEELAAICQGLLKNPDMDHEAVRTIEMEIKAFSALFEWSDGPLVHAMTTGDLLLLDEVSLADDSVLERLNSVLEPGRTLVLAEKGGTDIDEATLVAHANFHVVATMNPGGDFGKKELSPALRNRFTEIWVPPLDDRDDLLQIIGQSWKNKMLEPCGPLILDFFAWFGERVGDTAGLGLRDILAWVNFADIIIRQDQLDIAQAYHHGGQLVLVDGLESLPQIAGMSVASVAILRSDCMNQLSRLASTLGGQSSYTTKAEIRINEIAISVGGFSLQRGSLEAQDVQFRLEAPTTALNAMRVLRGCQLPKAILLEGSPGVGKTSLVSALASMSGHHLQRINLSDQTDLIDLFGSDLPVEGGAAGEFQWRDAAFLDAMQKGDWVLLDEMNLASQTVLEGLNAVLDHRGTVFIPELGRSFDRHPDFRVFAAQNPLQQGGGRKGLPKSFLNRFTKVYLQEHTPEDLLMICKSIHPMNEETVRKMITFNEAIREATMVSRTIGTEGSPWEFNLRDLFRWFSLLSAPNGLEGGVRPLEHLRLVYIHRFRNARDRHAVSELFHRTFEVEVSSTRPTPFLTPAHLQIGHSLVSRSESGHARIDTVLPHQHLDLAESVLKSIEMGWLVILAGSSGVGKRRIIKAIADGAGRSLGEFAMHPGVDTSEILGSFEQQDFGRLVDNIYAALVDLVDNSASGHRPLAAYREQLRASRDACFKSADETTIAAFTNIAGTITGDAQDDRDAARARTALQALSKAGPNSTGFAWVDGQLLDALRNGGWYLISNANLCSASVLDRLNSLCENNGVLVLSEKGSETGTPEVIKPHPDFRLFMTFDPRYGELSRAMRNRGVELFVDPVCEDSQRHLLMPPSLAEQSRLRSLAVLDATETIDSPSSVANEVVLQNAAGQAYLDRLLAGKSFGQHVKAFLEDPVIQNCVQQTAEHQPFPAGFKDNLPIEASCNPQIRETDINVIFRLLQSFLRNVDQKISMESFVSMSANNKSVLALSVQAARRGVTRSKKAAGAELWPFISSLRAHLAEAFGQIASDSGIISAARVSELEQILVLLGILESRAQSMTFDYSATQLLAQWLKSITSTIPTLQSSLVQLGSLAQSVEITTGQGQSEIWALMRKLDGSLALEDELKASLSNVRDPALRYSVLQALVAATTEKSSNALTDLVQLVRSMPASPVVSQGKWENNDVLSVLELYVLSSSITGLASQGSVSLLVSEPNANLAEYVNLACLGSQASSPSTVFAALTTWMGTAWSAQHDAENPGPAAIFSPTSLNSVLRFSDQRKTAMSDIPQQEEALRFTIDSVLWRARQKPDSRQETLQVLLSTLAMIVSAFGLQLDPKQTASILLEQLRDAFANRDLPFWLAEGYKCTLGDVVVGVNPEDPNLNALAELYTGLSQFIIRLYITNIPIDPAVRRILLGEVLARRVSLLEEELDSIERSEMRLKGTPESRRTVDTRQRLDAVLAEQSALGPSTSRSADAARLNVLFNEIHGFVEDALDPLKAAQLVESLRRHDAHALQREEAFQAVTAAFIHRLESNYSDMADLIQPAITAVYLNKFGLRILARDVQLAQAKRSDLAISILSFPTLTLVPVTSTDILSHILGAASVARTLAVETRRSANLPTFMTAIDNLYSTWSAIRLREQRDAQEADSLYRVKKTDVEVLSDVEQEEKEFKELFPSFEDVGEESDKDVVDVQVKPKEDGKFTSDHVLAFHRLLSSAYGTTSPVDTYTDAIDQLVGTLDVYSYDESLDQTSLAFQIKQLHRRREEVSSVTVQSNFYLSPNEPEVRKAHSILTRLSSRLTSLIAEWPEQMVLQHILDRVDRVLELDLRSSVAKVLSALEGLLLHTDDWEGYANKENSLKSYQNDMSNLIIEWRKLELASWMRLLEDQAQAYIDSDAEWTLRLYGALIHGSLSSSNAEEHIKTVLPLLNTYLSSSTLGHYAPRLSTLRAFEKMANEMSVLSTSIDHDNALRRISTLLHNVLANSSLFAPRIADSLATQRAALDKSIKDYVRLASWKDVNVYALKASAVNSHRHLHRSIRKFRAALSQPVSPILADLTSLCPQEPPQQGSLPATVLVDVQSPSSHSILARGNDDLPDHLARLASTFERYSTVLIAAAKKQGDREGIASALDGIAVDIIETAQELAKATPSTLTEENKKIVNNLASRKRKAFSDLLKALRASGFSNSVRADALNHQKDASWLVARPPLVIVRADAMIQGEVVDKINNYHARLGVLMIALREAFNGHNDDISSQDLERGIGFVESIYATSLQQRDVLTAQLNSLDHLTSTVSRLRDFASANNIAGGGIVKGQLPRVEIAIVQIDEALEEVEEGVRVFRSLEGRPVSAADLTVVGDLRSQAEPLMASLAATNQSSKIIEQPLYTQDELSLLSQAGLWLASAVLRLREKAVESPELRHLYDPVVELASKIEITSADARVQDLPPHVWRTSDDLIQRLLVVAQQLQSDWPEIKEDERLHVPTEIKHNQALMASLHIEAVLKAIEYFIQDLSNQLGTANGAATGLIIARILPFVEVISSVYAATLNHSAYNVKATYKLAYVTGRVMLDLAQKGFCKPQEADDSKDQDGGEGTVEGTGMGAGSGEKNVSNEITEESQVEGLQGEEEEEGNDDGNKDEDDAVSMDDDFDGDMGDGKEKEDGDGGEDDDEEEDHDEHVGDVDPLDPGAVDEKFWGDEKQEEKKDEGREDLMDQGQEESGEAELSAKEKEQEKESDEKDEKEEEEEQTKESDSKDQERDADQERDGQDDQGEEVEGDEMEQDRDDQGPEGEDEAGQQPPVQDEVAAPEGDTLDLPEDLDFEEEEGLNDDLNMDDKALPEDDEGEPERENDDIDMASQDEGETMDDAPPAMEPTEQESKEEEAQLDQNLDVSASNDVSNQENDTAGGASGQGEKEKQEEKEGEQGEDAEMAEEENEADPSGQGAAPKQAGSPSGDQDDQADGPLDSAGAPVASDGQAQQQQRSLGDIMKEIRRRRDEILSQQTQDSPTDRSDAPQEAGGQVEYLGEEDEGDDQALGAAGEEERQKLADLNIVDEEDQEQSNAQYRGMEDEDDEEKHDDSAPRQKAERIIKQEVDEQSRPNEKALTGTDIGGNAPTDRPDETMDVDTEEGLEGVKPEIEDKADDDVEVELNEDTELQASDSDGEATWRQYAALTSDLSYALCEQLRLILEPTLATRLQGDFRTGKRLNMRKIIPYIASEYTKDKIWLRRTKPSRREYQVLLSLDDSRSMADSHSVHLAYQTLALVSQALNKLEVGQVGIAKFGESVDILHPFGTGFSEADGAKVMASFRFDQHRTDVVKLVERTLTFLSEARQSQAASSSAPDLWQLQIIISDGVCQDHAKLRTLLRKALEERVMIVFIIIDSLHTSPSTAPTSAPAKTGNGGANARPSILSMQTVEYKNINGEMSLEMTRYLDTFPFEFFVVLRDVEALPGVLSDTLRQWMTRVSQSQE